MKVIWIKDDDDNKMEYILFDNFQFINTNEIILNNLKTTLFQNINCSKQLKLIILPTIKIIYPFGKNINLITIKEEEESSNYTILCNSIISSLININCSLVKTLYYINYFNPNCIKPIIFNNDKSNQLSSYYYHQSLPSIEEVENKSINIYINNDIPIYWYYQFLNNNIYHTSYNDLILCGKTWKDLFIYSNLTFICNDIYSYYIEMKPLYKLIIQYITTSLNLINSSYYNNDDKTNQIKDILLLTLNTIENNCYKKEEERNLTEIKLFNIMLDILTNFNYNDNKEDEKDKYCQLIYNNSHFIEDYSKWIPNYINYRNEWFFTIYKYFLLHNDNMYLYSIILSSFLISIVIFGLISYITIIILLIYKRVMMNIVHNKNIYVV
jgi:hypothetical protein